MASSPLILFALWATVVSAQEKVSVTVYFESYCPDSVKFLTKQLYPTFVTSLMNYMNVTLVPYGKATTTKSETGELMFTCHHEEIECKGNKVIACALHDKESTFMDQMKFINCTSSYIMQTPKLPVYPTKECSAMSNMKEETIKSCAEDKSGSEYLEGYGNKTMDAFPAGLPSIPLVVFNDKYVEAESKDAVKDFRKALCSKISGNKPAECTKSGASILQSAVLPLIAAVYLVTRV